MSYVYYIIACLLIFILFKIFEPFIKQLHMYVFARFNKYVTPSLNKQTRLYKNEIFACLHEASKPENGLLILEIGAGTGANFELLPNGSRIVCIEPNVYMRRILWREYEKFQNVKVVQLVDGVAEDMPHVDDACVDAVIATFVLCSVSDVRKCMAEILRVLKPGGKFCYLEHTVDPDKTTWTYTCQWLANALWPILFDGCTSLNDPQSVISDAGFSHVTHTNLYRDDTWVIPIKHITYGVATK